MKLLKCLIAVIGVLQIGQVRAEEVFVDYETTSPDWVIKRKRDLTLEAYNKPNELTLKIDMRQAFPNSSACVSAKSVRDIKVYFRISKIVQRGEVDWTRYFEKTTMSFAGKTGRTERKIYGAVLPRNGLRQSVGTDFNIGTLYFLAPNICDNLIDSSFTISGMRLNGRTVSPLNVRMIRGLPPKDNEDDTISKD